MKLLAGKLLLKVHVKSDPLSPGLEKKAFSASDADTEDDSYVVHAFSLRSRANDSSAASELACATWMSNDKLRILFSLMLDIRSGLLVRKELQELTLDRFTFLVLCIVNCTKPDKWDYL